MDKFEVKKAASKVAAERVCKALAAKKFIAHYAENAREACEIALSLIGEGTTVGIPGSVTVREIGLPEQLKARGCKIAEHWLPNMTAEQSRAAQLAEFNSDWFVTSANAITMDGTIVNIDGNGNRVAAMSWAPGKIIYIIGVNKITSDVLAAVKRVRSVASCGNALRLNLKTPCAVTGECADCNSPGRMCSVLTIIERAPAHGARECHVIIVNENLGY